MTWKCLNNTQINTVVNKEAMSLIKLLKAPIKLFKKDVITFVIVKRHDLGSKFHYDYF